MKATDKMFETAIEFEGKEVEVEVEYRYNPGMPGKTYGPPEDCYPDEPAECEVEQIFLKGDATKTDIMPKMTTEQIESVFEQACSVGEEHYNDAYEAAMEDKADAMRNGDYD